MEDKLLKGVFFFFNTGKMVTKWGNQTKGIVDKGPNPVARGNWSTVNVELCLSILNLGCLKTFLCYSFNVIHTEYNSKCPIMVR